MEYLNGKFQSQFRPDGRRYEGEWANGKQSGKGTYYNGRGEIINGKWKDGKRITVISKDSQIA